jgi:hypothetical protein
VARVGQVRLRGLAIIRHKTQGQEKGTDYPLL